MFAGLAGWHILILFGWFIPVVIVVIGIVISVNEGKRRVVEGLVTTPVLNTMAIVGCVLAFVVPPAGVVLGHLARARIRTSGEAGWAAAGVALWAGWTFTAAWLLLIVLVGASLASTA
ncbi:DUF4190 domain-containing protein [Microbacteriaceae bacterium VKM Ac-2855]|nr:DUF4190 domain-containing protein [Microbacteriaceae bacterium VKM Ac-2855]